MTSPGGGQAGRIPRAFGSFPHTKEYGILVSLNGLGAFEGLRRRQGFARVIFTPKFSNIVRLMFFQKFFRFIDFRRKIWAATSIGVIEQHKLSMSFSYPVFIETSFTEFEDQCRFLFGHPWLKATFIKWSSNRRSSAGHIPSRGNIACSTQECGRRKTEANQPRRHRGEHFKLVQIMTMRMVIEGDQIHTLVGKRDG